MAAFLYYPHLVVFAMELKLELQLLQYLQNDVITANG